ncbi:MAG: LysR family transcriptional regulator, partial [Nocardioidaceae bacterium]
SRVSAVTWGRMRTFLAVVDQGSVRAAAGVLHVTEPAVSAAVAQVEKHLSTELFTKDGRGIQITDGGRVYADYCRTILGLIDEAAAAVRSEERGRLRIGAVGPVSEYLLPRLLVSFLGRFPEIELSLSVLPRDDLFTQLGHHETDLVFAGRPPPGSGLVTRARRDNELIVVSAPGRFPNPLTATWLLRGPGSWTRDTTLGLLAQLDVAPPTLTLGTHGAVVAGAKAGLGVTLVHADAVDQELETGTLRQLAMASTPLDRPWHVASTSTPTRSALLFLDHITSSDEVGEAAFHLSNRPTG